MENLPTTNLSRSTLQTSSSSLGQAPDQHSIILVLQCLERLERSGCCAHEEVQEVRSLFADLLGGLEYGPSGFASTLPEGARLPIGTFPGNLLLNGVASYGLGVPGFPSNYGTYSNGEMPSESSARRDQQPRFPVEQGGQNKVKCTWPGCSRAVKKDNLTRHVNEMHRKKVKAVCTGCQKGFSRPYMLKYHTCPAR